MDDEVEPAERVRMEEFLQYLVDPVRVEPLNEHWEKIHQLCQPCSVRYDFVGRYETIETDADHVLQAVHVDHLVSFPRRSDNYKHNRTSTVVSSAYQDISPKLLWEVYESYQADFELFDYKIPEDLYQRMNSAGFGN